ncbi:class I SAM-dependent methyltransferase [bacterium]|nr:class I SAM-dependent methyltransferase [bacterium]
MPFLESLRRWISPTSQLIYEFDKKIALHISGTILDVGRGKGTPKNFDHVSMYVGLDYPKTLKETLTFDSVVDVYGDAQQLSFRDSSFDTVLLRQVLEHLPRPWQAIEEFSRVLKPGGRLLITTPLLYKMHSIPHDYYRYTPYALKFLIESNGLTVEKIETGGYFFAVLSQLISGYLYSEVMGLDSSIDVLNIKKKLYLIPFLMPILIFVVVVCKIFERIHPVKVYSLAVFAIACKPQIEKVHRYPAMS